MSIIPFFPHSFTIDSMDSTIDSPAGHANQGNILVVCVAFFAQTTASSLCMSLLSVYLSSIGLSTVWIGAVLTIQNASMSLTYMPSGRLSDRIGRKIPLLVGNALIATATLLMFFTKHPLFIAFILAGLGIGSGLNAPAVNALIAESVPLTRSGMAFAAYNISTLLASVIGSAFSGVLVDSLGYGNIFLISTTISALATALIYCFIRETERGNNSSYRSAIKESVITSLPGTVKMLKGSKELKLLATALCIHSFGISVFNPYVPLFASNAIHLEIVQVGLVISAWNLGLLVAMVPSGKMTDKMGARVTLFNHVLFSSLSWALYAISKSFEAAIATMLIFGIIGAMDMPARRTVMIEFSSGGKGKATVIGSLDSLIGTVGIVAPFIEGTLWAQMGYTAPFFFGSAVNIVAILPLLLLIKDERARRKGSRTSRPSLLPDNLYDQFSRPASNIELYKNDLLPSAEGQPPFYKWNCNSWA